MAGAATREKIKRNGKPGPKHNIEPAREEFYERISKRDMAPLWKVMKSVVTKEPVTRCVPHVWHYDDVRSLVLESGGLITAEEALRLGVACGAANAVTPETGFVRREDVEALLPRVTTAEVE